MKSYGAAEKLAEQAAGKEEPKAAAAADKIEEDGMYLFTTSTCPNCKMAKEMLAEEQYEVIDAERHRILPHSTASCRHRLFSLWRTARHRRL